MNPRVRVTALSYGPHGVARLDGKVLFLRGVAPGDEVEVTVREDHGAYAYADVVRVAGAATARREPPCAYLPRCGGCPWQHVEYAAQLQAKEENLRQQLRRIAGVDGGDVAPIAPSPREFGYRGRLDLRVAERRVGFYAAASHDLVEIERCLIAGDAVGAAIGEAAALVELLRCRVRRMEIVERGDLPGTDARPRVVLAGEVEGPAATGDSDAIERWLASAALTAGVALRGRGWRRVWGDDRIHVSPEPDLVLAAPAGVFTQVNPAGNRDLVRRVLEAGRFEAHHDVLDLYAGIGNFSVPAARRVASVVAVEQNPAAAAAARANAAALGLSGLEVVAAPASRAVAELVRQRRRFDVVVLDPPRSGAAEVIGGILELAPRRLVYVSCSPPTLARDLKRLGEGFTVERVQPVDLFPHTYHLESVVSLVLTRRVPPHIFAAGKR